MERPVKNRFSISKIKNKFKAFEKVADYILCLFTFSLNIMGHFSVLTLIQSLSV